MEDSLKAQHEAEKAQLNKDWDKKLKDAIEKVRKEE